MKYVWTIVALCLTVTQAYGRSRYSGTIEDIRREVFLFHDGTHAHMVIRATLNAKKFPKDLTWNLRLPAKPLKIEEIDGPLFEELKGLFPSELRIGGTFGLSEKLQTLKPLPLVVANDGSVLLPVRVSMNRPSAERLVSRPLHLVFKADNVFVPTWFEDRASVFGMDLYVFSKQEIIKDLGGSPFTGEPSMAYKNEHLHPMIDNRLGTDSGFITRYKAEGLRNEDPSPKNLTFSKEELGFLQKAK